MNSNSKSKVGIAVVLAISLFATGCSAQWLSVALADLPVLTQMALNIATLVATLQSGKQISPAEAAAIQNISTEASKDLNLLLALYNEYKANPSANTIQQIENVVGDIKQNLPSLLQAAHISNPTLAARITAGVNLILTTVSSFASLIPQTPPAPSKSQRATRQNVALPNARELKKQWNQQVCMPTGNSAFDSAFALCALR
jgi:hypothetical protein